MIPQTGLTRALLIAAAVGATLAACNRDQDRPAPAAANAGQTAAAVTTAEAAAPMAYETKTPFANVSLTLPVAIKGQGDLHAALYADEVRKLRQFVEGAQADRTEAGGDAGLPPFENTVTITSAAETGKLLSLKRVAFDYSGGAHPNTLTGGILWDKALKRRIGFSDLFKRGADTSVLDQALCSAINAAKRARSPGSAGLTLGGTNGDWSCPKAASTEFVLMPGDQPGKAAGLTFLIGPYQVGPYAEGAYEIAIPASVFRSLLSTPYIGEFGGNLARAGDVTPTAAPVV
ncbi:MAG: DUF3298 and DUF4163 domain-containing protein [Brevundimonas sp.]|uniref:DUF3298 and DUF4163 domain-containing protein n=1 Tax=Brevundimonas sp. TaxID=1871086 RepID=UPI004034051D